MTEAAYDISFEMLVDEYIDLQLEEKDLKRQLEKIKQKKSQLRPNIVSQIDHKVPVVREKGKVSYVKGTRGRYTDDNDAAKALLVEKGYKIPQKKVKDKDPTIRVSA